MLPINILIDSNLMTTFIYNEKKQRVLHSLTDICILHIKFNAYIQYKNIFFTILIDPKYLLIDFKEGGAFQLL